MMNHRGYSQQASAPAGHFIGWGELIASTGGGSVALSGGVLAGDLAVALCVSFTNVGQLSSLLYTLGASGYGFRVSYHVLDGTDQAGQSVSVTGGTTATTLVAVYRTPTVPTGPTFGFNDNTTVSPVVCPGFTKNAAAKSIPYFIGAPTNPTFGASPGTFRAVTSDGRVALADFDPASLYTNGTAESWPYTSLANVLLAPLDCH